MSLLLVWVLCGVAFGAIAFSSGIVFVRGRRPSSDVYVPFGEGHDEKYDEVAGFVRSLDPNAYIKLEQLVRPLTKKVERLNAEVARVDEELSWNKKELHVAQACEESTGRNVVEEASAKESQHFGRRVISQLFGTKTQVKEPITLNEVRRRLYDDYIQLKTSAIEICFSFVLCIGLAVTFIQAFREVPDWWNVIRSERATFVILYLFAFGIVLSLHTGLKRIVYFREKKRERRQEHNTIESLGSLLRNGDKTTMLCLFDMTVETVMAGPFFAEKFALNVESSVLAAMSGYAFALFLPTMNVITSIAFGFAAVDERRELLLLERKLALDADEQEKMDDLRSAVPSIVEGNRAYSVSSAQAHSREMSASMSHFQAAVIYAKARERDVAFLVKRRDYLLKELEQANKDAKSQTKKLLHDLNIYVQGHEKDISKLLKTKREQWLDGYDLGDPH